MIGDVCGKGAEAAAVTALARYTVRAVGDAALRQPERRAAGPQRRDPPRAPAQPLLHRALRRRSRCTATASPAASPRAATRCRWSCAPTAASRPSGLPGTLLGILPDPEIRPQKLVLRPGDSLILYTDGVIEASPLDHRFGPEQFARVRQRVPRAGADRHRAVTSRTPCSTCRAARCATTSPCWCCASRPSCAAPFVADQPGVAAST